MSRGANILQTTAQTIGACAAEGVATKVSGCLKPLELYGECSDQQTQHILGYLALV